VNRQPLWRPTTRRRETLIRWAPVLVIVAASLALGLGEDELRQWGRYDREALESGELWRLVTADLVHLGWGRLWLNLAALVMMAVLFRRPHERIGLGTHERPRSIEYRYRPVPCFIRTSHGM
jgi:membrane associated rhomboid family serine protease